MGNRDYLIGMGERISIRRKERGITQEQMAEKMGVSLQTVSNIECGKKATNPENIVKICRTLNTTADYILLGEKNESQIKGITKVIANLPEEKYRAVENIVNLLAN